MGWANTSSSQPATRSRRSSASSANQRADQTQALVGVERVGMAARSGPGRLERGQQAATALASQEAAEPPAVRGALRERRSRCSWRRSHSVMAWPCRTRW